MVFLYKQILHLTPAFRSVFPSLCQIFGEPFDALLGGLVHGLFVLVAGPVASEGAGGEGGELVVFFCELRGGGARGLRMETSPIGDMTYKP